MGKAVIVTGASTGIGLGIALKFLSEGHDVVLVGRSLERLESANPLDFKNNGKHIFVAQDVSTLEGCRAVVREGVKLLGGRLDVLVNNAGAAKFGLLLENITPEDWAFHMNLNLNSILFTTQEAVPFLKLSQGSIVNISSVAADRPFQGAGAYSVSKAAVNMLTKASALELAPSKVRVNSVNPGTVNTSIFTTSGMTPEQAEAYKAKSALENPLGRVGEPIDVAELCYFLTDNAKSAWLTGQCIYLDGGKLLPLQLSK